MDNLKNLVIDIAKQSNHFKAADIKSYLHSQGHDEKKVNSTVQSMTSNLCSIGLLHRYSEGVFATTGNLQKLSAKQITELLYLYDAKTCREESGDYARQPCGYIAPQERIKTKAMQTLMKKLGVDIMEALSVNAKNNPNPYIPKTRITAKPEIVASDVSKKQSEKALHFKMFLEDRALYREIYGQ